MNISFEQFRTEVAALQQDIRTELKKRQTPNRQLIEDGIVNIDEYYHSPLRVLWVLKEPYCDKKGGGGGWNMVQDLNTRRAEGKDRGAWQTWYPITYASYGLLNGFKQYAEMPQINRDPAVWLSLKKIAFINFQKLPGKPQTNMADLQKQVPAEERALVVRQIKTYCPHIVIFGSTLELLKNDLGLTGEHELEKGHCQKDGVLYLNLKHPAQLDISRETYVNWIVNRAKQYQDFYLKSNTHA